ncbi:MAG: DUF4440 domain-containing protein [Cytophagales bacterium]|nr:DUF4440 domain-containing protein [Cytophagales bacterium]
MRAKNLLITLPSILYLSCSSPTLSEDALQALRAEVMETDLAFSAYSQKHGFPKALALYAADDAIKLNPSAYPAVGKAQLEREASNDTVGSRTGSLTWKPLRVHVGSAGDLAAAFGDWTLKTKSPRTSNDTTLYGNYITVWKKQDDATWKFVMDGGNPTPGPTAENLLNQSR